MGVGASALAALDIFLCIFALPLYFQLVRGADASVSGLLVVPFLLSSVGGNFAVAWLAPRLGRMGGILLAGYLTGATGLAGLAAIAAFAPLVSLPVVVLAMSLAGLGLGMTMVGTLMSVQNALERRDTGAGTGALLVLRSLGSALGGALAGTLLASAFHKAVAAAGVGRPLDLGALRHGSEALGQLSPAVRQVLAAGVESGFQWIFLLGTVAALAGLCIAWRMPDLELRASVTEHGAGLAMD
jgi:MFS family permease